MTKIKGLTVGDVVNMLKTTGVIYAVINQIPKKPKNLVIDEPVYYDGFASDCTKPVLIQDLSCYDDMLPIYWTWNENDKKVMVF